MSAKKLTTLAMLCALALAAHYLEGLMPPLMAGAPVKLGLANIFTLLALMLYSGREALFVTGVRCVLGPLLGGSALGIAYSLSGGLSSLAVMSALMKLYRKGVLSPVGVSAAGAFCFNTAQILVGYALNGPAALYYFPYISLVSIPTGIFVGLCAIFIAGRLNKYINTSGRTNK